MVPVTEAERNRLDDYCAQHKITKWFDPLNLLSIVA
jgi:hypothetical protein